MKIKLVLATLPHTNTCGSVYVTRGSQNSVRLVVFKSCSFFRHFRRIILAIDLLVLAFLFPSCPHAVLMFSLRSLFRVLLSCYVSSHLSVVLMSRPFLFWHFSRVSCAHSCLRYFTPTTSINRITCPSYLVVPSCLSPPPRTAVPVWV